jgi:hypothetical protein
MRGSNSFPRAAAGPPPSGETGYTMPSGSIFKLQADLTTGVSTGGTVSTILDRSGNALNAPTVVGAATYEVVSSKPTLRFNGSSYYVVPFTFTTKPAAWTIVIVAALTSKSYQFICGSADAAGTDKDTWGVIGETSTVFFSEFGDAAGYNYSISASGVITTSTVNRLAVRYTASSSAADSYKNGSALTMSTSGSATSSAGSAKPFSIGSEGVNANTSIYLLGDLYFLQIWDRALSNGELAAVESSLISAGF